MQTWKPTLGKPNQSIKQAHHKQSVGSMEQANRNNLLGVRSARRTVPKHPGEPLPEELGVSGRRHHKRATRRTRGLDGNRGNRPD